jgi:pimeloyl-ACP methyl ester carboxylesterase
MIVLHGSFMTIPMMGEIVGRLAETHRVYAVELQGHGRTTNIDRPITYPNLAGDVATFMEAVGIEKADIFGYSMGAIAGLRVAIDYPEKVDPGSTTSRAGSRRSASSFRSGRSTSSRPVSWPTRTRKWRQTRRVSRRWPRR